MPAASNVARIFSSVEIVTRGILSPASHLATVVGYTWARLAGSAESDARSSILLVASGRFDYPITET